MDRCKCWHFREYFFLYMFDQNDWREREEEQKELTKKKLRFSCFFSLLSLILEEEKMIDQVQFFVYQKKKRWEISI